jgi:rhamnosyltransferase
MKIGAAIITYNPNINILFETINSIRIQVDEVLLVDNNSKNRQNIDNLNIIISIKMICLSDNTGIANATNVAIDYFLKSNFDYLIISDQDTVYDSNYINIFKSKVNNMTKKNIAAFVPAVYDVISDAIKPFYVKEKFLLKKKVFYHDAFVYQAIASGMIINMLCIRIIGSMKKELFIDYVDFEWCWRVHHYNWKIVALPLMRIYHRLGDSIKNIGSKVVSTHRPIREYYIVRNITYLALYSHFLGIIDKCILFFKAILMLIGYIILADDKKTFLYYCIGGFADGITKKLGRFQDGD